MTPEVQKALFRISSHEDTSVRLEAYLELLGKMSTGEEELRDGVIRLAYKNADLRKALLKLLEEN